MRKSALAKGLRKRIQGIAEVAAGTGATGHEIGINTVVSNGEDKGTLQQFFTFANQAAVAGDQTDTLVMDVGVASGMTAAGEVGIIDLRMGESGRLISAYDFWDVVPT